MTPRKNHNKLRLRHISLICIFIIGLGVLFSYCFKNKANTSTARVELDKFVQVGILDSEGKIIDNGSNLNTKNINHILSIDQKDDILKEYMLIILEDFKQVDFMINDNSYKNYIFKLDKIDSININIKLNLSKDSKELCYLVLPKPNIDLKNLELSQKLSLQNIFVSRFRINDSSVNLNYENNLSQIKDNLIPEIFISKIENEFISFSEINKNEEFYLTIGNPTTSVLDYAVILLKNWEQDNISDSTLVKYISLEPNSKITEKVLVTDDEKNTITQFIAFPLPYKVEVLDHLSTMGFASDRFIISVK